MSFIDNAWKILADIAALRGGTNTVESIVVNQETILDTMRSALSASYTMTGSEVTLYEFTPTATSLFNGGSIDMTTMAAGDTILVKMYAKNASGGAYVQFSNNGVWTFNDAQSVALKLIEGGVFNRYGIKITATQSAGTNRTLPCEFFDAAPGV